MCVGELAVSFSFFFVFALLQIAAAEKAEESSHANIQSLQEDGCSTKFPANLGQQPQPQQQHNVNKVLLRGVLLALALLIRN